MVEPENSEDVVFRPRARLVKTIGGDLIKDEMAGVIELVKNGFDADAARVDIEFVNLNESSGAKLVIRDDGHGMDRDTLINDWMSPATGDKGRRKTSPDGRPLLGRKGIGRFSAMRLGDHLILKTSPVKAYDEPDEEEEDSDDRNGGDRPPESELLHTLELDWTDFFTAEEYLHDVTFEYKAGEMEGDWSGTILEISKLKDSWDERRIRRLIRELRLLFSPIQHEHSEEFEIHLDLSQSGLDLDPFPSRVIEIEPYPIPEVTDYHLKVRIKEDGAFELQYKRNLLADEDTSEVEASQGGDSLEDLLPEERQDLLGPDDPAPCGPLEMEFFVWDRDTEILKQKAERLQDTEIMGVRAVRRLLNQVSGVSIYRDEFRVRPYGIEDEDWLGLGQRRVQMPATRLSENQLSGFVHISTLQNPELESKSSREGLKENTAFQVLREAVRGAIGWLEPIRYRFRQRNRLGRPPPQSTRALEEEREGAFQELRETLEARVEDPSAREAVEAVAKRAEEAVEEEHQRLDTQAEILHDNHSLGLLARFVLHEGRNLDGTMDSALNTQERIVSRFPEDETAELDRDEARLLGKTTDALRKSESRFSSLMNRLDPLTRKRRTRRPKTDPLRVAEKAKETLGPELDDTDVDIHIPSGSTQVLAWEADLFHAFFNLFHNALHWVQKTQEPHTVWVDFREKDGDRVSIYVSDSGPGIGNEAAELVFDLGYSEKTDGTGIGLFIAREAIERSGGRLELGESDHDGACFVITLEEAE